MKKEPCNKMIKYKVIKLTGLGMCLSCELARFDLRAMYKKTPVIPALRGVVEAEGSGDKRI